MCRQADMELCKTSVYIRINYTHQNKFNGK